MSNISREYIQLVARLAQEIEQTQLDAINRAASLVAATIASDGLVHVFGAGHSSLVAEDVFFRAGGLVPIDVILIPAVMHHEGAWKGVFFERVEGVAEIFLEGYELNSIDTLFVISNSGINAMIIDVALLCRKLGMSIVAVTSMNHSQSVQSRHSSGRKLYEIADVVIDNCGVAGDAALSLESFEQRIAPTSTVVGATILQSVMAQSISLLIEQTGDAPVWVSSNVPGGDEINEKYLEEYSSRIKHLT
jgi:uncharacterized phosphosugar-binding protein